MPKKGKLQFISVMQITGMILIVLSHSISKYAQYPTGTGTFVQAIQQAGLTAFMWCSGYLLVYTDSVNKYGYKNYLIKRAVRLLIPYVSIQLLMLLPKTLTARMQGEALNMDFIHILLYPRDGILPHLWFLPVLMLMCVLAPVLLKCIDTKKKAYLTLCVTALIVLIPDTDNILSINDVKNYLFWFVSGMVIAEYGDAVCFMLKHKPEIAILCISVYTAVSIFVGYSQLNGLLCSLCTTALLFIIGNMSTERPCLLGKYTFPIYILSLPVQNVTEIICGKLSLQWTLSSLLMFAIGMTVPLLIAAIVGKTEKKSNIQILSKCIGL